MQESTPNVSQVEVRVTAQRTPLDGTLRLPSAMSGLVIFAHGSGSSRHSPRNRFVAEFLNAQGLGTLLLDLLSEREAERDARSGALRFDVELLAERLMAAVDWAQDQQALGMGKIGLFGASTGAAAALLAAAQRPGLVRAVVSRGGRPDLAGDALREVSAPTLLIVGSQDAAVLELNRGAAQLLRRCQLELVDGAGHLFEEPGALRAVAALAARWFIHELAHNEAVTPPLR